MEGHHLKKYSAQFEDLPNELITEIFSWLGFKEILKCNRVSKRIRSISQNEILWQKVNLNKHPNLSCEFVKSVIENGCKYLNLSSAKIIGNVTLDKPTKLEYLDISGVHNPQHRKVLLQVNYFCFSTKRIEPNIYHFASLTI